MVDESSRTNDLVLGVGFESRRVRLASDTVERGPHRKISALETRLFTAGALQAAILFDKFHVIRHLGEALDNVRKSEYARLSGKDRRFIKDQKYTLLSRRENLNLGGRQVLRTLLRVNKRLNTAYLLKESFDQLWSYKQMGRRLCPTQ